MTDFADAADRHWKDAFSLISLQRHPNADHLYGLAAECALKAVMVGIDPNILTASGELDAQYKLHIDRLWPEFTTWVSGRQLAKFAARLSGAPFAGWTVTQRYHHRSSFQAPLVESHRAGCAQCMHALQDAILDGVVKL